MNFIVAKLRAWGVALATFTFASFACATDIGTAAEFVSRMTTAPADSYKLTADIDLTGQSFATVAAFSGTLDGGGHTLSGIGAQPFCGDFTGVISNLVLDCGGVTMTGSGIGALGKTCVGGKVSDVTVKNVTIKHTTYNAGAGNGAFFGTVYDASVFTRCVADSTCTLVVTTANNEIGGIAGKVMFKYDIVEDIVFIGCVNRATLSCTGNNNDSNGAGGIVGMIDGGRGTVTHIVFRNCENYGTFDTTGNNGCLGGIVGLAKSVQSKEKGIRMHFNGCVNHSDIAVSMTYRAVGGVIGSATDCATFVMDGCVNYGAIGCASVVYAGGLCGFAGNTMPTVTGMTDDVIRNCANYGNVTGKTVAGGIAGIMETNTGWNSGMFYIRNCASYGTVATAATIGQAVGKITTKRESIVDNCFAPAGTVCGANGSTATTVTNCKTPDDATALTDLNTVATAADGYVPWVAGSTYPELSIFVTGTQSSYAVVFYDFYGEILKIESVAAGGSATAPDAPSRAGYAFLGWDQSFADVSTSLTTYPVYEAESHTLTFDSLGGSEIAPITALTGTPVSYGMAPTKSGYVFKGWSLDRAKIAELPGLMPTQDRTYYAIWVPEGGWSKVHVKMKLLMWALGTNNPGQVDPIKTVVTNKEADVCSFFTTKSTYDYAPDGWTQIVNNFNGSSDAGGRTVLTRDATTPLVSSALSGTTGVPASNSSTGYAVFETSSGAQILLLSCYSSNSKTIESYISSMTNQFVSIRAQYPGAFVLMTGLYKNFPSASDYASKYSSSMANVADAMVSATGFYKIQTGDDGYWILSEVNPTTSTIETVTSTVTSDTGYLANLEFGKSATYTVRFLDYNGSVLSTQTVEEGMNATPPEDPYRKGYTFTGWSGTWTGVTKNEDVTATYKEGETVYYVVRFLDWDGKVLSSQKVAAGNAATPPSSPVRAGYNFTGWNKSYSNILANTDITAQYEEQLVPTVYVSTTGVDADGGGQIDHPFKTIKFAVSSLGTEGGEVRVFSGLYNTTYQLEITNAVSIIGLRDNGEVIVHNTTGAGWYNPYARLFYLNHAQAKLQYLVLENGSVQGVGSAVCVTAGRVEDCVVRGCSGTAHSTDMPMGAIYVSGADSVASRCVVSNCTSTFSTASWMNTKGYLYAPGLCVKDGALAENCLVRDCCIGSWTTEYYTLSGTTKIKSISPAGAIFVKNGGRVLNCNAFHCRGPQPAIIAYRDWGKAVPVVANCVAMDCWEGEFDKADILAAFDINSSGNNYNGVAYNCAMDTDVVSGCTDSIGNITGEAFTDYDASNYIPRPKGALYNAGSNEKGSTSSTDISGQRRLVKVIDIGAYESQYVPGMIITGKRNEN